MKKCYMCNIEKSLDEFNRDRTKTFGRTNRCKICSNIYRQAHRKISTETMRKWRLANKKKLYDGHKKWKEANKEQYAANQKLSYAVRRGTIQKSPCVICGEKRSQAHHENYSKPFEVDWLCIRHHHDRHMQIRGKYSQL